MSGTDEANLGRFLRWLYGEGHLKYDGPPIFYVDDAGVGHAYTADDINEVIQELLEETDYGG